MVFFIGLPTITAAITLEYTDTNYHRSKKLPLVRIINTASDFTSGRGKIVSESGGTETDWRSLLSRQCSTQGEFYWRIAYGIVGDSEAARDVCQQAFLKAWKQRQTIRQPHRIHSWLCRTVLNESFALLRRKGVERRYLQQWPNAAEQMPSPEDLMAQREWVITAMAQLEEPTRSVVAMRLLQGESGNEVARTLGCSASEVSRRLHQGLEQLRSWMNQTEQAS